MLAQDFKSVITEMRDHLTIELQAQSRTALARQAILKPLEYRWAALGLISAILIFGIGITVGTVIAGR